MSNLIKFPEAQYGVEFHGPFVEQWKVTSEGYRVPYLSAIVRADGNVMLGLDERFMVEGSKEEVCKWIGFIANAMAVAAGYSCHGENCRPINAHQVKLSGITVDEYGEGGV